MKPAAPPPAAKPAPIAPPPPAAKKDVFGLGAGPELGTPLEEDWSDLSAPAPAAKPAPIAPPPPEPGFGDELGFEAEPALPKAPPAPIELPEEPAAEPELAPMHAFVPPPEKVGHKPAPIAPPPPAAARGAAAEGDGGEALLREALSKASLDVIERVVWEVVPQLAETIIKENLERLVKERQG